MRRIVGKIGHLEGHLGHEDDLVGLEKTPGGVLENIKSDAVNDVRQALLHRVCILCLVQRLFKHVAESLVVGEKVWLVVR